MFKILGFKPQALAGGFAEGYNEKTAKVFEAETARRLLNDELTARNSFALDEKERQLMLSIGTPYNLSFRRSDKQSEQERLFDNLGNLDLWLTTPVDGITPQKAIMEAYMQGDQKPLNTVRSLFQDLSIRAADYLVNIDESGNQTIIANPYNSPMLQLFSENANETILENMVPSGAHIFGNTAFNMEEDVAKFIRKINTGSDLGPQHFAHIHDVNPVKFKAGMKIGEELTAIGDNIYLSILGETKNANKLNDTIDDLIEEGGAINSIGDVQDIIAWNIPTEKTGITQGSITIKKPKGEIFDNHLKKTVGITAEDITTGWNNANKVVERVERIETGFAAMEKQGGIRTGPVASLELFLRAVGDVGRQFTGIKGSFGEGSEDMTQRIAGIMRRILPDKPDEDAQSVKAFEKVSGELHAPETGHIHKYKELRDKYVGEGKRFANISEFNEWLKENTFTNWENTQKQGGAPTYPTIAEQKNIRSYVSAAIQYHSYLLSFDMAAAIQGGGDSRTISDRDVRGMAESIRAKLFSSGMDFQGVIQEIKREMTRIRDGWEVYQRAVQLRNTGMGLRLLKAGQLMNYARINSYRLNDAVLSGRTKRVNEVQVSPDNQLMPDDLAQDEPSAEEENISSPLPEDIALSQENGFNEIAKLAAIPNFKSIYKGNEEREPVTLNKMIYTYGIVFQNAREQKGPVPAHVISSLIEDFNLFNGSEAVQEIVNRTKIHPVDAFISLFPKEQDKFKARDILIEHLESLRGPAQGPAQGPALGPSDEIVDTDNLPVLTTDNEGNLISMPQGAQ